MPQIERYLFRQLRGPTIWVILALAAVGMLSQSLSGLDLIVDKRQSAWLFISVTLLAMPKMLSLIVPLGVFVAALMTFNRLHTEQEIIVSYAGGVSRWQVASPALRWATWLVLLTLLNNLWIQPLASRQMRTELNAARADLAATLVREGQFTEPAPGLTVYAQSIDSGGLMHNLFIHKTSRNDPPTTYTASEGQLTRGPSGPAIVMRNGSYQWLSKNDELNYVSFEEYLFNMESLQVTPPAETKADGRFVSELLNPAPTDEWGIKHRDLLLAEFHSRLSGPLYNLVFMAFAISAILGGGFSRLGYPRRMAWVSAVAITVRILGFVVEEAAADNPLLNLLQYLIPITAFGLTLWPFILGGRFRLRGPKSLAMQAIAAAPASRGS